MAADGFDAVFNSINTEERHDFGLICVRIELACGLIY